MIKCAFYEKEITPPLGAIIPGGFDPRYAVDVRDRLYVKAIVIDNGKTKISMIVLDACMIPLDICEQICERVEEYTDIKAENIMICANHTHTGAPIAKWMDNIFPDDEYVKMLIRLSADCITLATRRLENGVFKYGSGNLTGVSFNRDFILKDGTVVTNPGPLNPNIDRACAGIDPEVSVVLFENEQGVPKGAVISFACHQDCLVGEKNEYSGDYSSILSKELKKLYGEEFVSFFVEGACGNITCLDAFSEWHDMTKYVEIGKKLAGEVYKTAASAKVLERDVLLNDKHTIKIKKRMFTNEQVEEAKAYIEKYGKNGNYVNDLDPECDYLKLKYAYDTLNYIEDESEYCDVYVQVMNICGCLLYAMPGEQFYQFGIYLKENSPTETNVIATLCNGSFGYIPPRDMFGPYLYETRLCTSSFLEPEAGYIISEEMEKTAKNLYK